jgi:hypothetical protein
MGSELYLVRLSADWALYVFYNVSQLRVYRRSCIRSKREEQRSKDGRRATYT